ncbi:TRAP transporter substrate-binding protein [Pueribacillus sp. YX66]|uniref:TRAP transporter substrate-binding protein n=1 Tax=Pueribacillus sp. YX66 TaxID=3229242 RepID=UPI00358D1A84
MFSKRRSLGLMMFLLSILLIACGSNDKNESASSSEGKKDSDEFYEININNWATSTHHYAYNVYEPWKELVEEKTDGRVKVNIYHGASLGKSSSVYQDVKGGLYEVSLLVTNYFYDTNFFPYTIGNLPFAFESSEAASKIMKEFGEKYANDDLKDIIVMDPTATDAYDLFSTKPVKAVEDMKNMKIRASGKSETELAKSLGGVPVTLTTDDTYEGLQKKQVDTTFYTPIGSVGMKFFEPAPYITKLNVSVTPMIPVMNKDFYEKLPDDLKKLFDEELNPALSELFTKSYETELEKSYEQLEKELASRGEIITIPDKELQRFKQAGKVSWDEWIEDANKKGYPGQEMVDELFKMMEEEGLPTPF